jgi:hypothetical protein
LRVQQLAQTDERDITNLPVNGAEKLYFRIILLREAQERR